MSKLGSTNSAVIKLTQLIKAQNLDKSEPKLPEFRAVELKVPSLAKVTDPEGEIFDDLDDDEDFGARVASKEKTDQVRKSQIMDLNKQNQWEKSITTKISENQKIITRSKTVQHISFWIATTYDLSCQNCNVNFILFNKLLKIYK